MKEKKIENREQQCQCIRKGKLTRTNGKVGSNMTVFRGVSMQRDPDVTSESVENLRRHKEDVVLGNLKELKLQERDIVNLLENALS